jgi:hypothetical protein
MTSRRLRGPLTGYQEQCARQGKNEQVIRFGGGRLESWWNFCTQEGSEALLSKTWS